MRLLLTIGVLALVCPRVSWAAERKIEAPADVDAAEVAAFEAAAGRFTSRMNEFRDEARAMVARQESQEAEQLRSAYGAVVGQLEQDDKALRDTAIRRFEEFLGRYPDASHSAHVMFRLSELYFEKAEDDYLKADAAFMAALEKLDESGELEDIAEEPVRDLSASISLYTKIIEKFPEYEYLAGCYYMMGWSHNEPSALQHDEQVATEWFQRIIDEYPDSEFASRAHYRMGDYYFENMDLDQAVPHYERVVELEGVDSKLYENGLYKLAWTHYRKNDYNQALSLFVKLLDWSAQVYEPSSGKPANTVKETIEYVAISLSDVALDTGREPLDVARGFFSKVGEREYEPAIYKQLADVLTKQTHHDEAIAIYEHIQQRWPNDPDNPKFQQIVASLHVTKIPPDREASDTAIARLNELYNDETPWWRANRNNPDALSVARRFIEESLVSVAVNAHSKARETENPADYWRAAELYGNYLLKFPFASDYYEIQWYYAQVLQASGNLDLAEKELEQLRKGGDHAYKEASLYRLRMISGQRLLEKYEKVEIRPEDAVVAKTVTSVGGAERPVYELGPYHKLFVERTDGVLGTDFNPVLKGLQRQIDDTKDVDKREIFEGAYDDVSAYAEALETNRSAMEYQVAQVLNAHGWVEEARERLVSVIERYPRTENACYAAALDADTYLAEQDLVGYRRKVAYYASANPCGGDVDAVVDDSYFQTGLEQVDFKLAATLAEQEKFMDAADAFVKFYQEYPDSKYRKLALQNAANNFERAGKLDDSIRMLELYVSQYPDDELSRSFLFRLAGVYAQALDLKRAIDSYETLYRKTKGTGYVNSPVALMNAAYLKVGIGDFAGAARLYEEFGNNFPEQSDVERQVFKAGEQWERVGPSEALGFYRRYINKFGDQNPDHAMEALYRSAVLTEERGGKPREVDAAWQAVKEAYVRMAQSGKVGALGRHYAAHAEYRELRAELEAFREVKFSSSDEKNGLLIVAKAEEMVAIDRRAAELVTRYADFEYSSAALLVAGEAYLIYSDILYNAPMPRSLDEEEQMLYTELIDEKRIPVEDKAKARLQLVLDNAAKQKRWSEFQSDAIRLLSERYPREFAPEKAEIRGATTASAVRRAGPIPVRAPQAPETKQGEK